MLISWDTQVVGLEFRLQACGFMLVVFRLPPANWPYYSGSRSLSLPPFICLHFLPFFYWPHLTAPSALWRDCDVGQRIRFRSLLSHHVGRRTQSHCRWNTHRHRAARETRVRTGATGAAAAERDTCLHCCRGECQSEEQDGTCLKKLFRIAGQA